jgi:hypothetical protein
MIEKEPNLFEELYIFAVKIFIPATIAISIKVAMQIKKEKTKLSAIVFSFIIGLGCAYFVYPFIDSNLIKDSYMPLMVGLVAMSGEKIAEYFIYKWDVGRIIDVLIDNYIRKRK